jgi:hypothetical protein
MRIPLAALALLLLAPASCETYDKSQDDDPGPVTPETKTPAAAAPAAPKEPPAPPKKVLKPEELGTCKLTATGALQKEQTTQGGRAATNVTYWMKEDERKSMMGTDGFAVNCHGPDIKFSLIPSGKKDGMPFKPKKYAITKGTGDASVMVLFGKQTLDAISGTVDVTAFDKRHIAGTIDVKGKLVPGGGQVKLTGTFDLVCPGFGGCEI